MNPTLESFSIIRSPDSSVEFVSQWIVKYIKYMRIWGRNDIRSEVWFQHISSMNIRQNNQPKWMKSNGNCKKKKKKKKKKMGVVQHYSN